MFNSHERIERAGYFSSLLKLVEKNTKLRHCCLKIFDGYIIMSHRNSEIFQILRITRVVFRSIES